MLFIWALWIVISRLGVVQTLTIYDIAALRFLVATVAVSPFVARHWPRDLALWKTVLLSLGPGVPYVLLALEGLRHTPASHAGVVMNGALPIFAAGLGWVALGERPGPRKLTGSVIVLVGCAIMAGHAGIGRWPEGTWTGQLLLLGAAFTFAAYLIAIKIWAVTPRQALVSIPTLNLVWFAPIYLLYLPKRIGEAPVTEILTQGLYQGLGPGIAGVVLFTIATRGIGPVRTAAVLAGVPGLATVLAILLLGEQPNPSSIAGVAIASVGIALVAGWTPWGRAGRAALGTAALRE